MSFKALYNVPYHTVKHRKQHTAQGDTSVLFEVQQFRISKRRWVTFSPTLVTGVLSQKEQYFLACFWKGFYYWRESCLIQVNYTLCQLLLLCLIFRKFFVSGCPLIFAVARDAERYEYANNVCVKFELLG